MPRPHKAKKPNKVFENTVEEIPAELKRKSRKIVKKDLKFTETIEVDEVSEVGEESCLEEIEEEFFEDDIEADEESFYSQTYEESVTENSDTALDESDESDDETFKPIPPSAHAHVYKAVKGLPPDFFDLLHKMPEIDQISLTESMVREIAIKHTEAQLLEPIKETSRGDDEADEGEAVEQEDEFELDTNIEAKSSTDYSDFEFDFEDSEEDQDHWVEKKPPPTDEHLFETVVKKQLIQNVVFQELDVERIARLEEMKSLENDARAFLYGVIEAAVNKVERRDSLEVLRAKLSKVELFRELDDLIQEFNIEAKINDFVHKKCVHYFRRQKVFRQITPDSKTHLDTEISRYKGILVDLDGLLGREICTEEITNREVENAEELSESLKQEEKDAIALLEELIRNAFKIRESEHLNAFVDRRLREMSNLRKELSTVRELFIKRQHTKKSLMLKKGQLENITDTLTLHDYEDLLIEQFILSKKLEEKTERFERQNYEFHHNLEFVAHIKERQELLFYTIHEQLKKLAAAEGKKKNLRALIYKLKTSRMKVKKQIREESFRHGLIGKPALLIDFDETVERVQEMRTKVVGLRAQVLKIEQKLSSIQVCGAQNG